MTEALKQSAPSEAAAETERLSDERLLARFHAERHETDFAELARRYQHSAYRVAFARCGKKEWAEEAVQEAFFRLSQPEIVPEKGLPASFKFWFFGIVSNIALNQFRSERRITQRARSTRHREESMAKPSDPGPASVALDHDERETLVQALGSLEEEQRLPIVLHFMEGLTQDQIGQIVGVTQSVIARRMASGLASLRTRLAAAGVSMGAIALPELLKSEGLLQLPHGMQHTLATPSKLTSPFKRSHSKAFSRRAPVAKPISKAALVLPAVALLAVAGWALTPAAKPSAPVAPSAQTSNAPSTPTPAPAAKQVINLTWDLRQAPPKDIKLVRGAWNWIDGQGMEVGPDSATMVVLPVKVTAFPLRAELTLASRNQDIYFGGIFYTDGVRIPALRGWTGHMQMQDNTDPVMVIYLTGHETLNFTDNKIFSMEAYGAPMAETQLCIGLKNARLRKITLRSASQEDLQAIAEDVKKFKQTRGEGLLREAYPFQQ